MSRELPGWLAERLGERSFAEGGPRHARRTSCRVCGALVLRGLNEDHCAVVVSVDPTPLDPTGEWIALSRGLQTVAIRPRPGRRLELARRDHWQIAGSPAGSSRLYVVAAEHVCPTSSSGSVTKEGR